MLDEGLHEVDLVDTPPATPEADALNWDALRRLSLRPGGFREERATLWPRLLNVDPASLAYRVLQPTEDKSATEEDIPLNPGAHLLNEDVEPHPDERQVRLDTDRSFVLYPVDDMKDKEKRQNELHDLIVSLFRKRRRLSYFQGYHDIVSVLFLTLPKELQLLCVEKLSLHRVRDSMGATLEPVVGLMRVLNNVLAVADPDYAAKLQNHSHLPYYALSNLLTLFSHDMPTLPLIQHVYDYLLSRPPVITVYLAAAVLLMRKQEVDRLEEEGEDGLVHSLLSGLPDLDDEYEDGGKTSAAQKTVLDNEAPLRTESSAETSTTDAIENAESETPAPSVQEQVSEEVLDNDSVWTEEYSIQTVLSHDAIVDGPPQETESAHESSEKVKEGPVDEDVHQSSHVPRSSGHALQTSISEMSSSMEESIPSPRNHERSMSLVHVRRPHISLSALLERSDELYALYPPSHPSIGLSSIMGPQSVVFTWSEKAAELPTDEEAELMVTQPSLIVLPVPEETETKEELEDERERSHKRRRRRLHKPRRLGAIVVERKTVVASAVLVLGVAMAIYGLQATPEHHHNSASRELRRLSRVVGGFVVGAGERLFDGLLGMTG